MNYILKNITEKRNILEKIKKNGEFRQLERLENEIEFGQSLMITDDYNDPNILLSMALNDGVFRVYVNNNSKQIIIFLESFNWGSGFLNNTTIKEFLNNNGDINKNENLISYHFQSSINQINFNELDDRVRFILKNIMKSHGFNNIDIGENPSNPGYSEYTLCKIDTCNKEKIINQFKLKLDGNEVPLSINEGHYICGLWKYKTMFTMDEIIWSIKNGFSWCYKLKDGTLISWVIGFSDGRITQFATLPEFRGKGYGTKVVSKLIISFLEKGINPLAYIGGDNDISQSLFKKIGYNRSVEVFGLSASK
ncbi:hypothetical protein ACTFIU_003828 [Dictyostelium citrinum]